ncbi:hypothetical protein [Arsenicibacter rosenii]|uniref:Uncharacterized protein n=1 Tax=Arsenicibacter rosenii TaxID=1750698 RepID=A0A1S2VF60_9BACT|nr:hypothetical protein [Arsenicibacter rosenii]OIN57397.1 hypothetical protein BLX24_19375 [Arsenicibacter rosenii]
MKTEKRINRKKNRPNDNWLPGRAFQSAHKAVYHQIRNQVMAGHEAQLQTATGWRKRWLLWKINLLTEIRYNEVLFSGGWGRVLP